MYDLFSKFKLEHEVIGTLTHIKLRKGGFDDWKVSRVAIADNINSYVFDCFDTSIDKEWNNTSYVY